MRSLLFLQLPPIAVAYKSTAITAQDIIMIESNPDFSDSNFSSRNASNFSIKSKTRPISFHL